MTERASDESLGPEVASTLLDLRDKPPEPLAPSPQSLGIWELAWPTIISFATQTAVRWADFAMVGSLGTDALAAVGLGGQVYWLVQSVGALVPTGLVAVLARAIGAGKSDLADATLRQSLMLSAFIGLVTTFALLPFCDQLIEIYGVEPSVVEHGSAYVYWLLWGTVPMATAMVFGTALRAAGDARSPLYIGVLTNLVNLLLNWILIYGNLGFPALGVAGAAIASSLSMFLQIALFWWLWVRNRFVLRPGSGGFRPDFALMRRLSIVGYPAAFEGVAFQVGLLAFQRIMSVYGTPAIAAYNVGAQILSLSFLPGIGFATAAGTLVGQHLGSGSPEAAARSGRRAMYGAIISMSAIGLVVLWFREALAGAFTDDPEVIRLTVAFIWVVTVVQPMMAVEFAIGGALRGAGDTLFPLVVIFVGLFVCRLIPAAAMVTWWDVTVEIIFCALIADWTVKAAMLWVRFRRGKWKHRVV